MAWTYDPTMKQAVLRLLIAGSLLFPSGCFRNVNPVDTSDAGITARFKSELKKRPEIEVQYLDIDTHAGILTISGIAATDDTRYEIVRIARRLKGVKQVIANLVVRP